MCDPGLVRTQAVAMSAAHVERVTGSARRRRERRLHSMLRHERMSVAVALAEKLHHSACRAELSRKELVEHVQHSAARGQKTASGREAEFFDVFDEELGGGRPPPLPEVAGPQARVWRAVEKTEDFVLLVQIMDTPVPQVVYQPVDVLTRFDTPVPQQVIEVPVISCPSRPPRAVLGEPQMAEQLVDVPTIVSLINVIEQTVDIPVGASGIVGNGGPQGTGVLLTALSSRTCLALVEVFMVHAQTRVPQRFLDLNTFIIKIFPKTRFNCVWS